MTADLDAVAPGEQLGIRAVERDDRAERQERAGRESDPDEPGTVQPERRVVHLAASRLVDEPERDERPDPGRDAATALAGSAGCAADPIGATASAAAATTAAMTAMRLNMPYPLR